MPYKQPELIRTTNCNFATSSELVQLQKPSNKLTKQRLSSQEERASPFHPSSEAFCDTTLAHQYLPLWVFVNLDEFPFATSSGPLFGLWGRGRRSCGASCNSTFYLFRWGCFEKVKAKKAVRPRHHMEQKARANLSIRDRIKGTSCKVRMGLEFFGLNWLLPPRFGISEGLRWRWRNHVGIVSPYTLPLVLCLADCWVPSKVGKDETTKQAAQSRLKSAAPPCTSKPAEEAGPSIAFMWGPSDLTPKRKVFYAKKPINQRKNLRLRYSTRK